MHKMEKPSEQCAVKAASKPFPTGQQIRDHCDCGKHKNYPLTPLNYLKKKPVESATNYSRTYKPINGVRPRSSKRPLYFFSDVPRLPMTFDTHQKRDFKPLGIVDRVKPVLHADNYEASREPIDGLTSYTTDYTPKQAIPEMRRTEVTKRTKQPLKENVFATDTTSKTHFKEWEIQPAMSFKELPTFTGSIIFPGQESKTKTTFQSSFLGKYQPPAEMAKTGRIMNLKNEGDMHLQTTSQTAFKAYEGDHRAKRAENKPVLSDVVKGLFASDTQSKDDFQDVKNRTVQKAVAPPQPTIKLNFDDSQSFSTEQRSIYKGHDIAKHPVVKSFKEENKEYVIPTVKFASMTSQKDDYKEIDLNTLDRLKVSRFDHDKLQVSSGDIPFDASTTNKLYYKDWGRQNIKRYGDLHDQRIYVPPLKPMQVETTTGNTYTAKIAQKAKQFIPQENLNTTDRNFVSFDTEYNLSYKEHERHICPSEKLVLRKAIQKQETEQINSNMTNNIIAVA